MFLRVFSVHNAQFAPQRPVAAPLHRYPPPLAYKQPERKARAKSRAGSKDGVRVCRQQQASTTAPVWGPDMNPAEDYEVLSNSDLDTEFEFV